MNDSRQGFKLGPNGNEDSVVGLPTLIAELLPSNGAYFRHALGRQLFGPIELRPGDKIRMARNDLSLGWHVPERYAADGQDLPLALKRFLLLFRVYEYLTSNASEQQEPLE